MTTKDTRKFSRSDFQLTRIIAVLVTLATFAMAVVGPIVSWAVGEPLVAQVDHLRETAATGGKPGVTLTHASGLTATFADAGALLWLASILPGVLFFAILLVVVWLLWGLLGDIEHGEPFMPANVRRMRGIALAIVAGAFVLFLASGVANGYLTQHALEGTTPFFVNTTTTSDLLLPGAGFLIAALAEAFKRGVELEGETEGLI